MLEVCADALVDLIVESYDATEPAVPWAARVVRVLMGLTSSQMGVAFHFTSAYVDGVFHVRDMRMDVEFSSASARLGNAAAMLRAPGKETESMLGRTQATTAGLASGLGAELCRVPFWREIWPEPIVDSLGLVSLDASGDGFIACVGLDHLGSLTQRERRLLARVGTHVGAGDRLRRGKPGRLLDEAEAVLSPSGKVLHAVERAKNRIDSLREGRERREEARKMQHDPEKALEIWRGLVAGRWSLVDHFDTDGKRFLLAVKNTPGVEGRADLTSRERRVTALAAMGHRDKEIAYILGLSVASVTAAIHRARGKLGVRTRAELAAVWRRGGEA